jgi:hypothetical protein
LDVACKLDQGGSHVFYTGARERAQIV